MLKVAFVIHQDGLEGKKLQYEVKEDPTKANGYWLEEIDEPTFFKFVASKWLANLEADIIAGHGALLST